MKYKFIHNTENFRLDELACKCKRAQCPYIPDLPTVQSHIKRLQKFRKWYGRQMKVTSGYRCPIHNKNVGGSSSSYHVKGIATDLAFPPAYSYFTAKRKREFRANIEEKWWQLCKEDGLGGGIGWYEKKGFFHIDSRPYKTRWNG